MVVKPSIISHEDSGLVCFAVPKFQKGDIFRHYYGTLLYKYISGATKPGALYDDGIMSMPSKEFSIAVDQLETKIFSTGGANSCSLDSFSKICHNAIYY